jgi:hypothetical protein
MRMRDIIDDLKSSLRALGASGITGSEAIGAFASAWQDVGRLEAIHETAELEAAMESGQRVRFPAARPIIDTIDPDAIPLDSTVLTDAQIDEAFVFQAKQDLARVLMGNPHDEDNNPLDLMADDDVDGFIAAFTPPRIASTH